VGGEHCVALVIIDTVFGPIPCVENIHVTNGEILSVHGYCDPRPMLVARTRRSDAVQLVRHSDTNIRLPIIAPSGTSTDRYFGSIRLLIPLDQRRNCEGLEGGNPLRCKWRLKVSCAGWSGPRLMASTEEANDQVVTERARLITRPEFRSARFLRH
jgi:hypothetical protein